MKLKHKILFSLTFLFGMALTACVDEKLTMDQPTQPQEGDTPFYVKLRLKTSDAVSSRADGDDWSDDAPGSGFKDGTHDEHAISANAGNIAIFFDESGKYISWAKLYSVHESKEKDAGSNGTPNPEATYSCRFNGFADRQPKYVLVAVNLDPSGETYKNITNFPGWDIDDVMKNVWAVTGKVNYNRSMDKPTYEGDPYTIGYFVDSDKTAYFTMSNSTYVSGNGSTAKIHCAQEIDESNFFMGEKRQETDVIPDETPEQIVDATESLAPVTVYLERMVAKMALTSLNFDPDSYRPISAQPLDVCTYKDGSFTYTDLTWGLQILGWGMNGLETQSYLFKNLPKTDNDWLSHTEWTSNSEYNKRSYWAQDPHYFREDGIYPWQFDLAKDKYDPDSRTYYDFFHSYDNNDLHGEEYVLTYYPFMHFCSFYKDDKTKTKKDFPAADYKYNLNSDDIYIPENTFAPGLTVDVSRGSRAYELAGSHLLVCARLLIGDDLKPFDGHIYRNRVGVTYLDEVSMFEDFMNAINWKLEGQTYMYYQYFPWDDDATSEFHQREITYEGSDTKDGYGETIRALVGGTYALYYRSPEDNKYFELNSEILYKLNEDSKYRLWRDADAINADGKIIPWIMYNSKGTTNDADFEACDMLILLKKKNLEDTEEFTPSVIDNSTLSGQSLDDYLKERKLDFQYKTPGEEQGIWVWKEFPENARDNNDIQSLFFEIWGVADDYNHGLMYYAVPIHVQNSNTGEYVRHKNVQLEDGANPEFLNDDRLYSYFGVIRNNWYKFNIHSINEIGVPISDPAKPIVPNYINKKDQIKVNMEVGQWHIEDQTVVIK